MEGIVDGVDTLSARQFFLAVKRLADSLDYGSDRSPFLRSGLEYVQSRLYEPGDSIRSIDWRVTARTGRIFVKQYETPKQMPVYLLVDTSASMTVGSQMRSKYAHAVFIAGGIAYACLDRISPVGVLGVGGRRLHVEPSLSRSKIMQWLHELRRFRYDEPTTLSQKLAELIPSLPHRALVIALTDLHDPGALPLLKRLAQQHDCVILQLIDSAEQSLRGAGIFRATEAETGRRFVSHGRHRALQLTETADELRRGAIDHVQISLDQPYVSRLRQFFRGRDLLGRGAR